MRDDTREEKNQENRAKRILGFVVIALLVLFFLFTVIPGKRDYSEAENRTLTQRPAFTWSGLVDGSYAEQTEQMEADRFVGRPFFREVSVLYSRIGGNRVNNGVIRGRKGQLLLELSAGNDALLKANSDSINRFAQRYPAVTNHVLLVPDAAEILADCVPSRIQTVNQTQLFGVFSAQLDDAVVWMDGTAAMRAHAEEKLYYETDAHWTTQGAYEMFLETASDLAIADPEEVAYETRCASYDFKGALARTSGYTPVKSEAVDIYLPEEKTSYLVSYGNSTKKRPTVFDADALDGWDQYQVFFGGEPYYEIETASDSERVLLVVKDSFADSYIPFLIPYFAKIIAVDPAQYDGGIDELVDSYGVTDTLFLFEGNSFLSETDLASFLAE